MMQRLRKRPRLDTLASQQRAGTAAWGRRIYLCLLAMLALAVLDYAIGDVVFFRADGIALANRQIVAATYAGRVVDVRVREGQSVGNNAVLVRLESADMLKEIAELSSRNAELASKTGELRLKLATIDAVLPLADRHAKESAVAMKKLDSIAGRGLVSITRLDQALGSNFGTASRLADLEGQSKILGGEIALLEAAFRQAEHALGQFEAFYDQGWVKSATAGVVGPRVPVLGQVVKFGDELMQVYGSQAYVLAYLPDTYIFSIVPGQEVAVGVGTTGTTGRIETVLGVADALPPEFQNMFRPRDRSRLIRVALDDPSAIAISQKVRVTACGVLCWAKPHLARTLTAIGGVLPGSPTR
jgi:multidrug resistance efflux pump